MWFLFLLSLAAAAPDPSCKHTREEALRCVQLYADLDKDGFVTEDEVQTLRDSSLHFYERALSWIAGETTATVMLHCDHDRDGRISAQDFADSYDTCLRDCDGIEHLFTYICDRQHAQ